MKRIAPFFISFMFAGAAWAQEAITQPLPKSEIAKYGTLEGDLLIGYNADLDISVFGFSGQGLFGVTDTFGVNGKLTALFGNHYSIFTFGGDVAFEFVSPPAAAGTAVSAFAGLGLAFVTVDIGRDDFTDTDGYIEFGVQADLYANPSFRIIPFLGMTVVFGEGSGVIFGLGAKAQYEIAPTWYLNGGLIGQVGDISDSILFMAGIVKELR